MKIVQGFPPNIRKINKVFKLSGFNPIFTYGDTIYNPLGDPISQDLMIHEETHGRQQQAYGPEQWWEMYLENATFRLTQEVEAYGEQYKFLKSVLNRKGRKGILQVLAGNLSSAMYGNIINKKEAEELIENYA